MKAAIFIIFTAGFVARAIEATYSYCACANRGPSTQRRCADRARNAADPPSSCIHYCQYDEETLVHYYGHLNDGTPCSINRNGDGICKQGYCMVRSSDSQVHLPSRPNQDHQHLDQGQQPVVYPTPSLPAQKPGNGQHPGQFPISPPYHRPQVQDQVQLPHIPQKPTVTTGQETVPPHRPPTFNPAGAGGGQMQQHVQTPVLGGSQQHQTSDGQQSVIYPTPSRPSQNPHGGQQPEQIPIPAPDNRPQGQTPVQFPVIPAKPTVPSGQRTVPPRTPPPFIPVETADGQTQQQIQIPVFGGSQQHHSSDGQQAISIPRPGEAGPGVQQAVIP